MPVEDKIYKRFNVGRKNILYSGDCFRLIEKIPANHVDLVVTSPPYCMGKAYERTTNVNDFIEAHRRLLPEIVRITRDGGSICWQLGYHAQAAQIVPLDYLVYDILRPLTNIKLRNRIVWSYGHGLHARNRFSGRHETILWFTKGDDFSFNLDAVRVPQKYPGKKYYKGSKKGQYSGNPLGKNPGDVWEIPNVKANHVEKTKHPCQFPVALVQRLIRGLTSENMIVFDPFMGSGTTGVAAVLENRQFIGAELDPEYYEIAYARCLKTIKNEMKCRPINKPIFNPKPGQQVSKAPVHFRCAQL